MYRIIPCGRCGNYSSTIGYHKIYVETVWATEIEEDLPEEETEYTMDLKEYTAKRIGTNLAVTKLKQNNQKGERNRM